MSQLTTGPVVDSSPKVKPKPTRPIDLYNGEPPQTGDGKTMQIYQLRNERCGVKDERKDGKPFKCNHLLLVQRIKNSKFERDDNGYGGQLIYNEKDVRQYKFCPEHGPFTVPESW